MAQKYKKYFRNQTLFIKCSSYKSPKKKAKCRIVMLVPNTTKDVASYTSWLLFRHFSNIAC